MNNFIKKLIERIDSIFKNGGDNWSSQRVMSIALVLLPIITWTIISLSVWSLVAIPESVIVVIALGLTGKVVAKKLEKTDGK